MIIKVTFTQPNKDVPVNNQHNMNGFNHSVLGKDNKWHDSFSDYAISSLQGGKLNPDKMTLGFPDEPYIMVSSENEEFLTSWLMGAISSVSTVFGMKVANVTPMDFGAHSHFDKIITISPIIVKKGDWKLTIKDEGWLDTLILNTKKKLEKKGIYDDFSIEIINPEKAKVKRIWVGDTFNDCTMARFKVTGSKMVRNAIYNMGLGSSTGSGFGFIKVYE